MQQPMGEPTVEDGIMILDDASVVLIEEPPERVTPWDLDDAETRVWIRPYAARFHARHGRAEAPVRPWSPRHRASLPLPGRGHSIARSA